MFMAWISTLQFVSSIPNDPILEPQKRNGKYLFLPSIATFPEFQILWGNQSKENLGLSINLETLALFA